MRLIFVAAALLVGMSCGSSTEAKPKVARKVARVATGGPVVELKNAAGKVLYSDDSVGSVTEALLNAVRDGIDLTGIDLYGQNVSNLDLRKAKMRGANCYGCNASGTNFEGADLTGADFYSANLNNAKMKGAVTAGIRLYGADLAGTGLKP